MVTKNDKINDRYQLIKSIGEGGMANVYLAYDTILDRNVAVKILRGDLATDEKFVRRFQREALSASSLTHPNIVEVYDVGEDNGNYYIVMEYIDGRQLKNLIKKRGKLSVSEAVDIVLQITDGLSVAHDSYIIHRDIKPQNIMILENGLVKITDFGIAMAMNSTQLTQTNSVMGSVHYLPPEQASGKGATLQSDIYSIGILFYELLTGKLPFKGENAVEIALKHLKESLPSIREDVPNVPQSIENIIIRATAKNPKNRYADAREMHEDLKTCLEKVRENEPLIKLKYSEVTDDVNNKKSSNKDDKNGHNKNRKNSDDEIAKKITGDDLKRQNKMLIKLASIFTGLIIVVTLVFVLIMFTTKRSTLAVPDVSNKSVNEAIKILQNAGFEVLDEQESRSSDTVKSGNVIKTSPEGGSNRKKGSKVKLYVSTGDATIKVEDYTGMNYLEVKGSLEARGIIVNIEEETIDETNTKVKNGDILRQSIKPEESLKGGEMITLFIASVGEVYPDFTDGSYNIEDIKDFCKENELSCTFNGVVSDIQMVGTIISQSRQAGDPVKKGAKFVIKYIKEDDSGEQNQEPETCTEEEHALGNC